MDEWTLVRGLARRIGATADVRLRRALDSWAEAQIDWLGLPAESRWTEALTVLSVPCAERPAPHVIAVADTLASVLALDAFDTAFLRMIVAADRLPRFGALTRLWNEPGRELPALLAELAGAPGGDAGRAARRSAVLRLGLVSFRANRIGMVDVDLRWPFDRLLDRATPDRDSIVATLIGPRQTTTLAAADFAHVAAVPMLMRLLAGAIRTGAPAVNILIHGPPGTGKTELARVMATHAGLSLHAVGEIDEDGSEPTRWDRLTALQLAQRTLGSDGQTVLLFDEMEDLIGDARPSVHDWVENRAGSKVFINRLLETNAVPVIWTTNTIGNVDSAILRRMSFVLKLDVPSPAAGRRIWARIADAEGVTASEDVVRLLDAAPEAASVLRIAARTAQLSGAPGDAADTVSALASAMRGAPLPPVAAAPVDPDLFDVDADLDAVLEQIGARGASLLLTGPPGTGKTAFAHHIARALDRRLMVRRASDLLSRWVGGTEEAIAGAFADARARGEVLLFDEVDSLLFDRTTATHSWEAGQVNEMLTWLDHHPLPVIAATNHAHRLDPAALRRFVFKLDLRPLGRAKAALAFQRFFGCQAPASLAALTNLTPGDFAVVARQIVSGATPSPDALVAQLAAESTWKPDRGAIGFQL